MFKVTQPIWYGEYHKHFSYLKLLRYFHCTKWRPNWSMCDTQVSHTQQQATLAPPEENENGFVLPRHPSLCSISFFSFTFEECCCYFHKFRLRNLSIFLFSIIRNRLDSRAYFQEERLLWRSRDEIWGNGRRRCYYWGLNGALLLASHHMDHKKVTEGLQTYVRFMSDWEWFLFSRQKKEMIEFLSFIDHIFPLLYCIISEGKISCVSLIECLEPSLLMFQQRNSSPPTFSLLSQAHLKGCVHFYWTR